MLHTDHTILLIAIYQLKVVYIGKGKNNGVIVLLAYWS